MRISAIIPTRNRPERLNSTLDAIGTLGVPLHEVVVIDNASTSPAVVDTRLANGTPVRMIELDRNAGAGARNFGAEATDAQWLLMLDDDSHPVNERWSEVVLEAPEDVFAIGLRIRLPDGQHEAGGLPEVFVGCGALIRREAFLDIGGYDESFEYYAEEYDLCARAIARGWRVIHDGRLEILHHKTTVGRNMDRILRLLVRNNSWVIQRHAPANIRERELDAMINRYRRIAGKEDALGGFKRGLSDLDRTINHQRRNALSPAAYSRFRGAAAVEKWVGRRLEKLRPATVGLIEPGKGADVVDEVVRSVNATIVPASEAEAIVVSTLSPGPMTDAVQAAMATFPDRVVMSPWRGFAGVYLFGQDETDGLASVGVAA